MAEMNVYVASNFLYSFAQTQEAYITEKGFYSNSNPPLPDKIFEYVPHTPLSAVSIILYAPNLPVGAKIHAIVLDENNVPIPGNETTISSLFLESRYVFETPVPTDTILRFKLTSTNLSATSRYLFCNITVTNSENSSNELFEKIYEVTDIEIMEEKDVDFIENPIFKENDE